MIINRSKIASNDRSMNFDFDEWQELYQTSPEEFEARRLQWCEQIIKDAPQDYQRRLSGLLFQINMEKRRSKNPMDSCLRVSGLMWNKLLELRSELQGLVHSPASTQVKDRDEKATESSGTVFSFASARSTTSR